MEREFLSKNRLATGDKIWFNLGLYSHVVVVLGTSGNRLFVTENQKVHGIRTCTLGQVLQEYKDSPISLERQNLSIWQQNEIIRLASLKSGEAYDVFKNNCEHYANFLTNRKKESPQIQAALFVFGLIATVTVLPKVFR